MAEANKVVPLKKPAVKKKKAAAKKPAVKKTVAKAPAKKAVTKPAVKKPAVKKAATIAKTVTKKKAAPKAAPKKKTIAKKVVAKKAKPKTSFKPKPKPKTSKPKTTQTKKTETFIMTQPNFNPQDFAPKDFEAAQAQFDQFTKEAANINREGIDAIVKSGTIFAKGFENIIRESIGLAQSATEKQMQLAKDAMTSKTINEFSDAQNKIAQSSFDDFMSGTTKITELGVKVLTEAIEPINDQVAKSVQKATEAVAAE